MAFFTSIYRVEDGVVVAGSSLGEAAILQS